MLIALKRKHRVLCIALLELRQGVRNPPAQVDRMNVCTLMLVAMSSAP